VVAELPLPDLVRGLPLLGSAHAIGRDPIGFLLDQYRVHGPIFRVRAGHVRLTVLAGPEANEFVHDVGRHLLSNRQVWAPTLAEFGGPNNFVGLDGEPHAELRRLYGPRFSKRSAEAKLDDLVEIAVDSFRSHDPGDEIPFVRFSQRLVSRQVGELLVGQQPTVDEHEAILRYTNAVVMNLSLRRLPRALLRFAARGFRRDREVAHRFSSRLVSSHLSQPARPDQPENFIDTTVRASRTHPHLIGPGEVGASGLLPFFAGVDTVGQTVVFALYELLRHHNAMERATADADAAFAEGGLTPKSLREAGALTGAVMETLRMYPAAFAMPRTAAEPFAFAGRRVEQGTEVLVFTTVCHFLPEYFPDPLRFDIDRFAAADGGFHDPNVFAPFGRGPHLCLGAGMAGVQMTAILATILHFCSLELAEPERTFRPVLRPSLSLGGQFRLRFTGWRRDPPRRQT